VRNSAAVFRSPRKRVNYLYPGVCKREPLIYRA
jgi:hypothetical protein